MSHTCGYYRTQGLGLVWFVRQEKPGFVSHGDTGQHWRITSMCDTPRPAIPRDTHRGPQAPKGKAGAPLTPSAAWRACSPGRTSQHCCRRLCPSAAPRGPCTRGFLCRAQQHKTLITSTLSLGENSLKINILSIRQPSLGRINFNCFILLPMGFRGYLCEHRTLLNSLLGTSRSSHQLLLLPLTYSKHVDFFQETTEWQIS